MSVRPGKKFGFQSAAENLCNEVIGDHKLLYRNDLIVHL